nr:Gag-Pol polyprotein [Tanacetum cinerariifolium]
MSVEDLVFHLRIKEDNGLALKDTYTLYSAKANMIEHVGSSLRSNPKGKGKDKRKNDKKSKGKSEYLAPKAGIVKQKFQGTCYNCDQPSHRASNCKMPKRVNLRQANMVNDDVDMIAMVSDVCAMIFEVNLVGTNHGGWWIDTGVTHHVCADKSMFHSFKAVDNGQKLYMGNSATADIKGEGDVFLKMTSEKELKLTNVLYVLEIRKNLVSGWLLIKFGFRLVFESDKFVLSKNQMYVGRGYAKNGMFKLNVIVVKNEINKMNSSGYLIESSNVWHGRLRHVNFNSMRRLIKTNSIPNFHIDSKYKFEICVEAKLTRTSFKSVKRKTKPLDMVHADICDLKSLPTKGGNKYFITFIDDCTKYCYVYLLKSKDEAIDKFVLYKTEVENQLGKKIKVIRSDKGGEYVSSFSELYAKHGIRHEFTAPYSPKQNSIAERNNRNWKLSRLDDEVVQDKRQRDENDLQVERQDQVKEDTSSGYVILCLYVDDMLIVRSNDKMIKSTKDMLKSKFDMKDMGFVDLILGRKIIRTQNGLVLSQAHYVDKILNTRDSDLARTPIDISLHLSKNGGVGVAQLEYSRIIGMIMYLIMSTRPDLAYVVSRLSRYTSNPSNAHWKAITKWICVYTRRVAISWKSFKQTVIAKSTMESEFIALDKCGEEAEWLRQFVEDIPRCPKPVTANSIHCDSQSAIGRAQSTMYNGKSRHICRQHNSIRQVLSTGVILIDYVASKDNIADPFTKGLSRELVSKSSKGIGLKPLKE